MKTRIILAAVALATTGFAETSQAPGAPVQIAASTSYQADPTAMPVPNQTVYLPELPTAGELTTAASAQGLTVERIVQTPTQVTAVYRTPAGQTNTVAYLMLPAAGAPTAQVVVPQAPVTSTVIVTRPAPVYYYRDYDDGGFCDPWPWYGPVSVGFGWNWGGHWGGHRDFDDDGFHHWRR